MDFPGGASGKESTLNLHLEIQEMHPRVGKNLGVGNGNPFPFFSPGKLYRQRSLVGYSPYGHKELTRMSTHTPSLKPQQLGQDLQSKNDWHRKIWETSYKSAIKVTEI